MMMCFFSTEDRHDRGAQGANVRKSYRKPIRGEICKRFEIFTAGRNI